MNPFDLVALAAVGLGILLGFRTGALPQILGLLGAAVGAMTALALVPAVREPLLGLEPSTRALIVLAGFLLALGIGEAVGSTAGGTLRRALGPGLLGALDGVTGAAFGVAQAVLILWLAGGLLANGPAPGVATQAQRSSALRLLDTVLPPPTIFAADIQRLVDASGLPEVFVGLEPFPAPSVERPTDPQAEAIARAATASTFRVEADVCDGRVSTGTGFTVRSGYVVTNAHVVAGAGAIVVRNGGRALPASAVLFDPELDVAVLHVPELRSPPLALALTTPIRGTAGAAIGYPLGGSLSVVPAAVAASYPATGRDLYGRRTVTRDVVELRAAIDRGDSGGPFVLPDGTVGGVIFAEARSDPDVGYALAPEDVAVRIRPGLDRTAAVDTGPCIP